MKKGLGLLTLVLIANQSFAATGFRATWNTFLQDYFAPSIAGVLVIAVAIGLLRNWEVITRKETMKEGMVNVGIIFGAVLIVIAVIIGVVALTGQLSNIQI